MSADPKSLEMRVAAIEDKLSHASVSADEMRAFQKVASLGTASQTSFFCSYCFNCVIQIPVTVSTTCKVGPCGIATQEAKPASGGPGFGGLGQ